MHVVEYNDFGDIVRSTDALGRVTELSYDGVGRVLITSLPGDEGSVFYRYDMGAGIANALGRLVEVDDPVQKKVLSYDRFGRIKHEKRVIKEAAGEIPGTTGEYTTSFEYDLLSRTRTIYYPEDPATKTSITARYRYSASGITAVDVYNALGKKSIISGVSYNEFGQITELERGNGTATLYTYDIKGRLTNLETLTGPSSSQKKIQDITYLLKS